MPEVHFITVGSGDCTVIKHGSDRISMIDICGGNKSKSQEEETNALLEILKASTSNPKGNYRMCENPTNPLHYIDEKKLHPIFRFISTHPDMDHLDGIKALVDNYTVENFWHNGPEKLKPNFSNYSYLEEDWDTYSSIKAGKITGIKSLCRLDGDEFKYANKGGENDKGDSINIAAPNKDLVDKSNEIQSFNDASYILVYNMKGGKVVVCGDAEDGAFEYAIDTYPDLMKDVALLLAPHHGRDSGRDYAFLDHLKPRFTLLGCAKHIYHRTSSWTSRGLAYCKQNQCGNMIAKPSQQKDKIDLYIQSKRFTENSNGDINNTIYKDMYYYKTI